MIRAHFFPNCKNLILKIYICKICKPVTAAFNYYICICKTDMARIWRIYIIKLKRKEIYKGKINHSNGACCFFLAFWNGIRYKNIHTYMFMSAGCTFYFCFCFLFSFSFLKDNLQFTTICILNNSFSFLIIYV